MSNKLNITLAQLNLTVGDFDGNLKKHITSAIQARDELHADIIVFPELSLIGYPAEDLLFRDHFIKKAEKTFQQLVQEVRDIYCVVSHTHREGRALYNACSVIFNGNILATYMKQHLPNQGVFDERRYFAVGNQSCIVNIKGIPVGLVICEDLWAKKPVEHVASLGARIILSPNASPFEINKHEQRLALLGEQAKNFRLPIVYVNNVGGQDDLVFDGGSMLIDQEGKLCQFAGFFNETLLPVSIQVESSHSLIPCNNISISGTLERIYQALVLAVKDYVTKNGFSSVMLGLSGGIDSALTLTIAVDALSKEQVEAIILPSRHTAAISLEDAEKIADNLGVKHRCISIEPGYEAFLASLKDDFAGMDADITEENIQARCRAVILMALSNKLGSLVLTTSNHSELAVGYGTLYGDMAGAFAVLKDIPKTLVYALANYRNSLHPDIPQRIIDRPPTAELAPNQTDEESLAPYPTLDKIIELYIYEQQDAEEMIAAGFDQDLVKKVIRLINLSEYKRKQAPIGPRINHRAFGKDRRYPVTNKFKA